MKNRIRLSEIFAIGALLAISGALRAQTPESGDPGHEQTAPTSSSPFNFDTKNIQFSGFGTLGMIYTHDKEVRYIRPSTNHPGHENPDLGPDTVLGVQANVTLGSHAALVLQAISRESTLGSYKPRASLAFLSYAFTPNVTVRAGRLRTPFFMLSESIDINYANPWIRPPSEIYSMFPFSELNGVDLLLTFGGIGGFDVELHPYYGTSDLPIYQDGKGHLKNVRGLNITATSGHLTLFAGYGQTDFSLKWRGQDLQTLSQYLRQPIVLNGNDILRDLSGSDGKGSFGVAGIQWDDGKWLFIGEYNRLRANRYAHRAHAWELTAGRRFGEFMPYVTLASHTEDRPITTKRVALAMAIPGVAEQLNEAVDAFLASRNLSQSSATLGLRWDFYKNTAFKLEFAHTRIHNRSWGSFFPENPNDPPATLNQRMWKRSINTLGVSVDVTF
ncbi:MAG: hypothetical protein LBI92_00180 [Azoarcus sp.]|nr:hypothetical protein [Azoarcus sp.]